MVHRHCLNEADGRAGFEEGALELLGDECRLRRVLHEHGVARQHRRHDHVHRDRERVVPCGDVEYDADGLVADEAPEAGLLGEHLVGEGRGRDRAEMLDTFDERALELGARLADGLAHHARDRRGVLVEACRVGAQHPAAQGDPGVEVGVAKGARRPAREGEATGDLVLREKLEFEGGKSVDGALDDGHQGRTFLRRRGKSVSGTGRSVR